MKMRKLAYLLSFALTGCLLGGCGKESSKTETVKEDVSVNYESLMKQWKQEADTDTIECWYTSDADKEWLKEAAKDFEEAYSKKVSLVYYDGMSFFEDMNQANQNGEGPDVYLIGNDQLQLAKDSGMAEENTWLNDAFWKENYPDVAKKAVTYQDRTYGYPVYFDTYCLVYDANLLETAPASVDDILAFLDEYEDTGSTKAIFRWDIADPYVNTMFCASYADLFGENGDNPASFKINSEQSVEAMEYFQSLSAYLWMDKSNISHDTIMNRIQDGTLVLGLCKSDMLPALYEMQNQKKESEETEKEETNYQISYVPSLTDKLSSTTLSTTYGAFINPYGDTALGNMFAFYLSYEQASKQFAGNGKLPVRNQKDGFDTMQSVIYAQYLNSQPVPKVMVLGDYMTESGIVFDAIWDGEDVKTQLDRLQSVMEQKIK